MVNSRIKPDEKGRQELVEQELGKRTEIPRIRVLRRLINGTGNALDHTWLELMSWYKTEGDHSYAPRIDF
jgi:hypothetical protein